MVKSKFKIDIGEPYPLGTTPNKRGVNFSIFSEHATDATLLLFEKKGSREPVLTVHLDRDRNKTYNVWHVFIGGAKPGMCYAYRLDGTYNPAEGLIYNKRKILIDPYAKEIDYSLWKRQKALDGEDNLKASLRGVVTDTKTYDWEGDKPLNLPIAESIIYELHVGNFTKSPTSAVKQPGKYAGLIEKIPYLKYLGINTVELMPVMDFSAGPAKNVWGYGTIAFFAPDHRYCVNHKEGFLLDQFRDMVKAFHKAGIEVILDAAFGFTAEGDKTGPVLSFKGIDNTIYYTLDHDHEDLYIDYSGCKNTLNCNHPVVAKFITDCLKFWVSEAHVDGFRLDEATLLSRDHSGKISKFPHVVSNIDLSDTLANTKFFAEPWDAAGAYAVGAFPGYRFAEWNGKFRDDIRKFLRGEQGMTKTIADRIMGSPDLYSPTNRRAVNSLNFVTSHDGFTLHDLVAYSQKHNEINGENNLDGLDENFSANYGFEGETDDESLNQLRKKQIKNFAAMLLLSKGVPMITMGDEAGRTQSGNNNAYCHDSELTWFDWQLIEKNRELLNFFKKIIHFRKIHNFFTENSSYADIIKNVEFHGCLLYSPGFSDSTSRVLSFTIDKNIHVMINMDDQDLNFQIPRLENKTWQVLFNTAQSNEPEKVGAGAESYLVEKKSIAVLFTK